LPLVWYLSTRLLRLSSLRVELPLVAMGIFILAYFSGLHAQPLTGTHDITGTSAFNPSGGQFATIKEAFDSLMARGVGAGGVTFRVQDSWVGSATGQDAEPNTIQLSTYPGAGPNSPVTLTFDDLSNAVYFAKAPNGAAGDRFIFRFTGSIKYFTLDGAGKLILKSTTATGGSGTTGLIGFVSVTYILLLWTSTSTLSPSRMWSCMEVVGLIPFQECTSVRMQA
jgi:hypothetical protein